MADYGVTPEGFVRPRLPEIRMEIIEELRRNLRARGLPDDMETRPDSVTGVVIDTFAEREAALWEMGEGVYYAMYPGFGQWSLFGSGSLLFRSQAPEGTAQSSVCRGLWPARHSSSGQCTDSSP